jgi:hypothetical protein
MIYDILNNVALPDVVLSRRPSGPANYPVVLCCHKRLKTLQIGHFWKRNESGCVWTGPQSQGDWMIQVFAR